MKFKIGDRVSLNEDSTMLYNFQPDIGSSVKPGQIFIISAREIVTPGGPKYSVEGAYIRTPNWYYMEENFHLVFNLKDIKKNGYKI